MWERSAPCRENCSCIDLQPSRVRGGLNKDEEGTGTMRRIEGGGQAGGWTGASLIMQGLEGGGNNLSCILGTLQ